MKYYKGFQINGVVNSETQDATGITSTEIEKKKLVAIWINVDSYQGNVISGYLEREKIIDEIKDFHVADTTSTSTKIKRIPVDIEIPTGQKFNLALKCGGSANNLYGVYEYELIK